jgi:hypothetical protein
MKNGYRALLPALLIVFHYLTGVGSRGFVDKVKSIMGLLAIGRKSIAAGEVYQLREPPVPYGNLFGVKKDDIRPAKTYFGDVNI